MKGDYLRLKNFVGIFILLFFYGGIHLYGSDTTQYPDRKSVNKRQLLWNAKAKYGFVLPSNDMVKGGSFDIPTQTWTYSDDRKVTNFVACAMEFHWTLNPVDWRAKAYRNPYLGIGLSMTNYFDDRLGWPWTLYMIYGGRFARINQWLSFDGELNLGYSTNWNHYDRFDNPNNVAIGWKNNIYVSLDLYLRVLLSKYWDVKIGCSFDHFSNGATRMPNRGINMLTPVITLGCRVHDTEETLRDAEPFIKPRLKYRIDHDIWAILSVKQFYFDGTNTFLSTNYVDYRHRIFAFSYAAMLTRSYKYKYGLSLDFLYDESVGSKADYIANPHDNKFYEHVTLGEREDRFSLGVSLKGEIVLPYFSVFANLGYAFLHKNEDLPRFYQMLGVKIQPTGTFFGTMGVRTAYFSKAQFITWGIGYTFRGKEFGTHKDKL